MLIFMVILAGIISFITSLWLIKRTNRLGLLDIPNIRSSHGKPTPKGGGVSILLGMLVALGGCYLTGMIKPDIRYAVIIAALAAIALIGFYSDRFNISVITRVFLQTLIAGVMVWLIGGPAYTLAIAGYQFTVGQIGIVFAVIWLFGITNFYNFMDGIDGLAAMQGIIAGIAIAIFGIILGDKSLVPMGLVLSGASAGFLILNFPPAKIFMGDTGSYLIGFYIASFVLFNGRLLIPIALVLGVFIFDPVATLVRRIIKREPLYQAHRSHFYQRAVKLGYSHLQVTAACSAIFLLLMAMACFYLQSSVLIQIAILIVALSGLTSLALWVVLREGRQKGRRTC